MNVNRHRIRLDGSRLPPARARVPGREHEPSQETDQEREPELPGRGRGRQHASEHARGAGTQVLLSVLLIRARGFLNLGAVSGTA